MEGMGHLKGSYDIKGHDVILHNRIAYNSKT